MRPLLATLLLGLLGSSLASTTTAFGSAYEWLPHREGVQLAMRTGKPIMYLVHKSWCGACKGLKTHFKLSEDIAELSKRFVLVQFEDDEEPNSPNFSPDGRYVPRILFAEPSGKIRPDISNDMGNPKYKYFYANPVEVLAGMEVALQTLEGSGSPIESGEEAGGSHGSSETEAQDEL